MVIEGEAVPRSSVFPTQRVVAFPESVSSSTTPTSAPRNGSSRRWFLTTIRSENGLSLKSESCPKTCSSSGLKSACPRPGTAPAKNEQLPAKSRKAAQTTLLRLIIVILLEPQGIGLILPPSPPNPRPFSVPYINIDCPKTQKVPTFFRPAPRRRLGAVIHPQLELGLPASRGGMFSTSTRPGGASLTASWRFTPQQIISSGLNPLSTRNSFALVIAT